MDVLREYRRRSLDLADLVRGSLYVARSQHDGVIEDEARSLLTRLAGDRFTIAVVGQFSRGKSTLMNALLGGEYLPTGVLPVTAVVTTVHYGTTARASFRRRQSTVDVAIPLDDVADLIEQSSDRRTELQVASVDIEVPAELLRLGVTFIDTPGMGSSIGVNSATTRHILPEIDAAIIVTGFDSALTEPEVALLHEVHSHTDSIFCVINKRDLVDDEQAKTVTQFVTRALAATGSGAGVFPVSALGAVRAGEDRDAESLSASGVPELQRSLEDLLTRQKSHLILRGVARGARALLRRQLRDLELCDAAHSATVRASFDRLVREIEARQNTVLDRITDRLRVELPGRLNALRGPWSESLHERIDAGLQRERQPEAGTAEEEGAAHAVVDEVVRSWLAGRSAQVTETVVGLVSDQIGEVIRSMSAPRREGPALVGRSLPEDDQTAGGWTAAELPALPVPRIEWRIDAGATPWSRISRSAREQRAAAAMQRAVESIVDRALERYSGLAAQWCHDLGKHARDGTRAETERVGHYLAGPLAADDIAELQTSLERLDAMIAELDDGAPAPAVVPVVARSDEAPSAERTCVVCDQQRETLVGVLSHVQYRLATHQHDQAAHARLHGFCALHTWTYQAISSPLGISAAYAAVADATAVALTEALADGQGDASQDGIAASVGALLPDATRCSVCVALADAEREVITALVVRARGDEDAADHSGGEPVLCVGHLARVLAAEPDPERARVLTEALAATLRREAQDMRSYALKREARFRWLLTDEETRAYRETLRLLAGDQALASVPVIDKELDFPETPTISDDTTGAA
jgi:GTPase SAR1 family protein